MESLAVIYIGVIGFADIYFLSANGIGAEAASLFLEIFIYKCGL